MINSTDVFMAVIFLFFFPMNRVGVPDMSI